MIPYVSIIVPVFNAESTLDRCLDSVLSQTYIEWECILVNDGSSDNSGSICEAYASKDCRFKVFHKKNGGVSSARNIGLNCATGKWITFLDADDAFGEGFLLALTKEPEQDLIVASYQETNSQTTHKQEAGNFKGEDLSKFLSNHLADLQLRTPWAKFFRKEIIGSLRFDESLYLGEDTLFCHNYYRLCKSIEVDDNCVYLYTTSNTKSKYKPNAEYTLRTFHLLQRAYSELGLNCAEYNSFLYGWFRHLLEDSSLSLREWYADNYVRQFYMTHCADTFRKKLSFFKQWAKTYIPKTY